MENIKSDIIDGVGSTWWCEFKWGKSGKINGKSEIRNFEKAELKGEVLMVDFEY